MGKYFLISQKTKVAKEAGADSSTKFWFNRKAKFAAYHLLALSLIEF